VQLRDLSREVIRQGHELTVLLPNAEQFNPWVLENFDGVQVLRLRAPHTKDISYVRRVLAEFFMPHAMLRAYRQSPLAFKRWDGVIWYSPSIFHGPLVNSLKRDSGCKSYLIVRDIFPEWAVDMELMSRGLLYRFFDSVARYQYSVADIIGVQTSGNLVYFEKWKQDTRRKLEVLQNWLYEPAQKRCSIRVSDTPLAGRKVFVYAGNMGVAQGMDIVLGLAKRLSSRQDVGFLFVGRGSKKSCLMETSKKYRMSNVLFFDEIDPDEIPDLYSQCRVGIVSLDQRHKSHNIPGKFLTYMQNGLPVLANVNQGNDLVNLIQSWKVGQVCESNNLDELEVLALDLLMKIEDDNDLPHRCAGLFEQKFSVSHAVRQIVVALKQDLVDI